jgi:hypothetical protein
LDRARRDDNGKDTHDAEQHGRRGDVVSYFHHGVALLLEQEFVDTHANQPHDRRRQPAQYDEYHTIGIHGFALP